MTIRRLAAAAAAIVFLNLLLTLQNIWPTPWVRPTAEISVEIAAIVLIIAAIVAFYGVVGARLRWAIAAALLALVIGRYADITAPALFGRRIDLFWDARHIPRVVEMLAENMPVWRFIAYSAGLLGFVAALVYAILRSVDAVAAACTQRGLRRSLLGCAAAVIALYGIGMGSARIDTEKWFALPVTPVYAHQALFLASAATPQTSAGEKAPPSDLKRLEGGDAFLFFFESYGSGIFETPRMRDELADSFSALERFAARSGWLVASAFLDSPTFGGASWLAHSTTLSGRWITREADYRQFLANPPATLVSRFRDAGYRTVALLPGTRLDWPEGAALGFDRIFDARSLDYRGPAFGWWTIPDQYSLETLYRREMLQPGRKPLFVLFASIMSHMPFGPSPPYQPDWSRMHSRTPYDDGPLETALKMTPDWDDITAGYMRTIAYNLRLLEGFLAERAPTNAFVVAMGDHQPPAIVSGEGASWSVPVHIFSQDPAVIDRFVAAGFKPGMQPARPVLARMDAFNGMFLKALDSGAGVVSR